MGGKRSGTSKRKGHLPKTFQEGSLARLDRRRGEVRALTQLAAAVMDDHGGEPSVLRTRATYRALHVDALLQRQEADLAMGKPIDVPQYLAGCQTFLRYATTLGLARRAKEVRLHEYLRQSTMPAEAGVSLPVTPASLDSEGDKP